MESFRLVVLALLLTCAEWISRSSHKPGHRTSVRGTALALTGAILLQTGCTAVDVRPLSAPDPIKSVLIQENPRVWRADFLDVLVAGFNRHGIDTTVIQPGTPVGNAYVVKYTARQRWDMAMYMSDATIWIYRNEQEVAKAVYHLTGGGGFSLMKWQGTATKMDPVIDELLAGANSGVRSGRSVPEASQPSAVTTPPTNTGLPPSPVEEMCDLPSPVDTASCRGELVLGMTTNEILKILGKPDEMNADGTMLRYGDRYLSLDNKSRLVGIADRPPPG